MPSDRLEFFRKFGLLPPSEKPQPPPPPPNERRVVPFRCAIQGMHCVMEVERIPGQEHFAITAVREVTASTAHRAQSTALSAKIDCGLIDWSDFYCPSCRRLEAKPKVKAVIFGCGGCGSIVCNARSTDEINARGRRVTVFRCYAECGTVNTHAEGERYKKWEVESQSAPTSGSIPLPDDSGDTLRLTYDKGQ